LHRFFEPGSEIAGRDVLFVHKKLQTLQLQLQPLQVNVFCLFALDNVFLHIETLKNIGSGFFSGKRGKKFLIDLFSKQTKKFFLFLLLQLRLLILFNFSTQICVQQRNFRYLWLILWVTRSGESGYLEQFFYIYRLSPKF
jgi:hypothetical protein